MPARRLMDHSVRRGQGGVEVAADRDTHQVTLDGAERLQSGPLSKDSPRRERLTFYRMRVRVFPDRRRRSLRLVGSTHFI